MTTTGVPQSNNTDLSPYNGVLTDQVPMYQQNAPQQPVDMAGSMQLSITSTAVQPQPIHQTIQPQMTGMGYPHPLMSQQVFPPQHGYGPQQGYAPQQQSPQAQQGFAQHSPQAPMSAAAPPQQFYSATPLAVLGQGSSPADCPMCRHRAMTISNTQVGNTTHLWAAGFCLVLCLGFIPYLLSSTMDVRHNCGHCGALLATWHRSGHTVVHAFG